MRDSNPRGVAPNTLSKCASRYSRQAGTVRDLRPRLAVGVGGPQRTQANETTHETFRSWEDHRRRACDRRVHSEHTARRVWTWLCSTILDDAEAAARAGKWLTWAIAYADSIDPLSSSVPRLPDPADLDPADLKPGGSTLRGTRPAAPRSVCGRDQETEM
jgi:hypothetical protein